MAEENEDILSSESTQENKGNKDNLDEIIPNEILEAIPEEERGRVASVIKQTMISGVMRRGNPISEKITSEHITQLISKSDDQDRRDREERKSERNYNLFLIILGLVFVAFLIVFLQQNEDLLVKVVIAIISFVGGFGFGRTKKSKEQD